MKRCFKEVQRSFKEVSRVFKECFVNLAIITAILADGGLLQRKIKLGKFFDTKGMGRATFTY